MHSRVPNFRYVDDGFARIAGMGKVFLFGVDQSAGRDHYARYPNIVLYLKDDDLLWRRLPINKNGYLLQLTSRTDALQAYMYGNGQDDTERLQRLTAEWIAANAIGGSPRIHI